MGVTYEGYVDGTGVMHRGTYQLLTTAQKISKSVQWAVFTKNAFCRAIALEGFGIDAMKNVDAFGAAKATGRIIQLDTGHHSFAGSVFATTPTSHHVGRDGNFTPELVEGGDEYAYAWHRMFNAEYIPDVDVDDNSAAIIDIKAQKTQGQKAKFIEGFNYCVLGHSSAPDTGVMGPSVVYSDLANLISVTQTRTVGGIATTNAYWKNQFKAITNIGGGGEMDRPITLRRSLMDLLNDTLKLGEATEDYLLLATQGAWQYYDRLMYADSIQGRNGAFGSIEKYDAAGIRYKNFAGFPMIWDPAVTVPYGATASTEAIYGIHIPTFKISIRTENNFKVIPWEQPRAHDSKKNLVQLIDLRYTPAVIARRCHFVAYNMVACPD